MPFGPFICQTVCGWLVTCWKCENHFVGSFLPRTFIIWFVLLTTCENSKLRTKNKIFGQLCISDFHCLVFLADDILSAAQRPPVHRIVVLPGVWLSVRPNRRIGQSPSSIFLHHSTPLEIDFFSNRQKSFFPSPTLRSALPPRRMEEHGLKCFYQSKTISNLVLKCNAL